MGQKINRQATKTSVSNQICYTIHTILPVTQLEKTFILGGGVCLTINKYVYLKAHVELLSRVTGAHTQKENNQYPVPLLDSIHY